MEKKPVGKVNKVALRQFQLYLVLIACEVASYEEIFGKILYTNGRMLRRDIEDLCESGLVKVIYSHKDKGCVHIDKRGKSLRLDENLKEVYLFPEILG